MGNVLGIDGVRMVAILFMMMCLVVNGQTTSSSSCSISADKNSEDLEQALELGYHMLFMTFSFSNVSRTIPISVDTPQPLTWVRVSGNHGKGLIWLRQNFGVFSLTSLKYGVHDLDINLSDNPEGCLSTKPASEIANDVRDFILNNFADPVANITWIGKEVCNARFREHEIGTEVYFMCCKKDDLFKTTCYELKRNKWMNFFFLCILVLPLIALMFAPLLIPFDLFRDYGNNIFLQQKVELSIHITKRSKEQDAERSKLEVPEEYFKDMPEFCKTLKTLDENQRYDCTLKKIHFYVERENLIGKDVDPFGPFIMLYDMLARYEIRRRGFSKGKSCREYVPILSGKILNTAYLLLIIILVNIPVIARLAFFFTYTNPDWFIANSLESLNLHSNLIQYSSFGVSIFPRLELYLIYLVLIGLFVLVQFFRIREKRKVDVVIEILKLCLRDSLKWGIKLAFKNVFKARCSVFNDSRMKGRRLAFVYFVLFLPFVVFKFVFYLLPTVNLVCSIPTYLFTYFLSNKCGGRLSCRYVHVRAIAKHVSVGLNKTDGEIQKDDDNDEDSNKLCLPEDMLIILILVCSLPFVILVVLDCLSFYIDIFIFVLIGLLLNASFTTKYVILSLMLAFYIRDLFNGVTNKYITFNNTIITKASLLNKNLQKITEFQNGKTPHDEPDAQQESGEPDAQQESFSPSGNFKLTYEEGSLSWKTKRSLFFHDRKGTPYIRRKVFSKACDMDCVGTPGPLDQNLIDVINNILRTFSFLFFIMLIVMGFSEDSGFLGTNQTLAAIAGGFVPWLFRKYLLAPEVAGVDIENVYFCEVFNDLIRKQEKPWTVSDIEIATTTRQNSQSDNQDHLIVIVNENSYLDRNKLQRLNP